MVDDVCVVSVLLYWCRGVVLPGPLVFGDTLRAGGKLLYVEVVGPVGGRRISCTSGRLISGEGCERPRLCADEWIRRISLWCTAGVSIS